MNFTQHVTQPTHNRGHTLDIFIITHGLSASISSFSISTVVDVGISDHFCVLFYCQWFYTTGYSRTNCEEALPYY